MILADEFEPEPTIIKTMKQSVPVSTCPLNRMKRSDYAFGNYEGKILQFSRKQSAEIIGNIDEAESQLADYYDNADFNFQIVEGIISPFPLMVRILNDWTMIPVQDHTSSNSTIRNLGQKLYTYSVNAKGDIENGHAFSTLSQSMYDAWIHRLTMAGIPTYNTLNWVETARLLVSIYRNEQKPPDEHSTLSRIIKPRLTLKKKDVEDTEELKLLKSLMYLSDAYKLGIGEKKGREICKRYVNLLDLAMADVGELSKCTGIGNVTAKKILRALGRSIE